VAPLAAEGRFKQARTASQLAPILERYGVDIGAYVLGAGTLEPRKNLRRLIAAHASLPDDLRRRHPLLIVGPRGWEEREVLTAAAGSEDVRLAGFVPDDDLAALYAACTLFCYPSLYEGFGLPVLEAMAAGAAVVTSNVSSLPEVGGDGVAYVEPEDERSMTKTMERLLCSRSERRSLAARGRRRAEVFTWERFARALIEELERAAGRP
jgi:glycosyltransferase involved in cell wall biosynthesis